MSLAVNMELCPIRIMILPETALPADAANTRQARLRQNRRWLDKTAHSPSLPDSQVLYS